MASIFTFDPDPPRVCSPFVRVSNLTENHVADEQPDGPVTRLEPEPQEGPIEYKLHLLLRPRRTFLSISTEYRVSGSQRSKSNSPAPRNVSETNLIGTSSVQARSDHIRQQRLEQLTTQLLWRLQQSSPDHSSSHRSQIAPSFPDASRLGVAPEIGRVIPGLENSRGALYEIGVADDGTLVGLTEKELEESISNLRAMASSLGCIVTILRKVSVGECEWMDVCHGETAQKLHKEPLWVVEAYVKPNIGTSQPQSTRNEYSNNMRPIVIEDEILHGSYEDQPASQIKITLAGATTSGKSSLLGNLTTANLDNGRGKSRLSLFKHQHEIVSGMTSSVTQELVGYSDAAYKSGSSNSIEIINYASGHVSSWIDIHGHTGSGRLALFTDSAGHLKYRRSVVRPLIGWAPDWTLLCVPADNTEDTFGTTGSTPSSEEGLGMPFAGVDLSKEHLDLCLTLNVPLVVVVTKLDLASKLGLRNCLAQVLTTLKAAGRKPVIIPNASASGSNSGPGSLSADSLASCAKIVEELQFNPLEIVPIILTSSVKGTGISTLHALLYQLPVHNLSPSPTAHTQEQPPRVLFHIEDIYQAKQGASEAVHPVLSGHVRYGTLNVGDELFLGPYAVTSGTDDTDSASASASERPHIPTSRSFPGALSRTLRDLRSDEEWRKVKVVSLRYLRLPVRTLLETQIGTVGVQAVASRITSPSLVQIHKGMVLADKMPKSKRTFVAEFMRKDVDGLSINHSVVIYVASVRASARVIAGAIPDDVVANHGQDGEDEGLDFSFEDDEIGKPKKKDHEARLLVTFQFLNPQYVEVGSQVLVMPGGGQGIYGGKGRGEKGIAGLEGFVGRVVHRSS